jgi:AcrR family transcriptional regulator
VTARTTKERIVVTAERLFAEHGVDGVSLRQIGVAAGSGNNSVVHYHFGSKDQLVQAVFEYRLPRVARRRSELLEARNGDSLRSWVGCQVCAVLEQSDVEGSHYLGFIRSFERSGTNPLERAPEHMRAEALAYQLGLIDRMAHLQEPLRSHRVWQAMSLITLVGAARERDRERGEPVLPVEVQAADVLDTAVAVLSVLPSDDTRAVLADTDLVPPVAAVYL